MFLVFLFIKTLTIVIYCYIIHITAEGYMNIIISNSSSIPIYEQIKNAIIDAIIAGDIKEDESIPSIRALAQDIRISVMTIKKAYDELEKEGYIVTRQGKGSFVAPRNKELVLEQARKEIEEHIEKIISIKNKFKISDEEINNTFKYFMGENNK